MVTLRAGPGVRPLPQQRTLARGVSRPSLESTSTLLKSVVWRGQTPPFVTVLPPGNTATATSWMPPPTFTATLVMSGVAEVEPKSGLPMSSVESCHRNFGVVGSVTSSA